VQQGGEMALAIAERSEEIFRADRIKRRRALELQQARGRGGNVERELLEGEARPGRRSIAWPAESGCAPCSQGALAAPSRSARAMD